MTTRSQLPIVKCWPNCAKCNKPVDQIFQHRNRVTASTTITVCCHNETQQFEIRDLDLIHANSIEITDAFAKRNTVTISAPMLPSIPG